MIRLKTTQAVLFISVLLVSLFLPLIIPNMPPPAAEAAVPGGSIVYIDEDTIQIDGLGGGGGKGFQGKQIRRTDGGSTYSEPEITFNLGGGNFCSVSVTIRTNSADRSQGTITIAAPTVLPVPTNSCNIPDAFSAWGGQYSNQAIVIGNSDIFEDTDNVDNKRVTVCSLIPLDREEPPRTVARVSEFFDGTDVISIKRGGRNIATHQATLMNPDSRSDTHARFCWNFDGINAGDYTATSRFAFASEDFEKVARRTAEVTIQGDTQPVIPGEAPQAGANADSENPPSCEEENPGISLSWFICSVINFFDSTIQGLANVVDDLLQIPPSFYTNEDLQQSWAYFRNIASFLLIIIGLVMIIGQAMTKG